MNARRRLSGVFLLALVAGLPAGAARTLIATEPAENLLRGEAEGVAVTAKGQLFLAPRLTRPGDRGPAGESVHVWDMVTDAAGAIFLGTGPDGRVLRVSPAGRHTTFYTVDEPMVTALALSADGSLLVASAPGGRIYRVDADGKGQLWCETEERYVWALATGPDGTVYAGTGESGKVLAISAAGKSRVLFDSDDTHIVSLLAPTGGEMLAGGAGLGLVYRIDAEGHALVLYDDSLSEVSALALEDDGSLLATLVAQPQPETRSPAVRIRLPDGTQVGAAEGMSFDEGTGPMLRGVIEGLPQQEKRPGSAMRGRLVRISPSGATATLWRSSDEVPFSLVVAGGRVLFGTGEPARLYRIEPGDDLALLATLPEAQVTGLLSHGRSIALATSNPAGLYHVSHDTDDSGVFLSKPFDAGGPAPMGFDSLAHPGADAGSELYTRTGNSQVPDETWSGWSPALMTPSRSAIVNPDGRYLQWRARFAGSHGDTARLSSVTLHYEPYNRPPRLREFYLDAPQAAVSDTATLRWATYDPDDDPVDVAVQYRQAGDDAWRQVKGAHDDTEGPADGTPGVDWRDDRVILDTRPLAEGNYEFRAVVDDQPGNHPGDGHSVVGDDSLFVTVDHTPPDVDIATSPGGGIELTASDSFDVRSLEVRENGRVRFTVRPVDGVYDSRREVFRFELPADENDATWSVRAIDSAGNKVEAPLVRP